MSLPVKPDRIPCLCRSNRPDWCPVRYNEKRLTGMGQAAVLESSKRERDAAFAAMFYLYTAWGEERQGLGRRETHSRTGQEEVHTIALAETDTCL